jgi:heptosyltransferase-2
MSWKRVAMEAVVWLAAKAAGSAKKAPSAPDSIFVLRNGDIGDLLVVTPIFQALHELYPQARLVACVGEWNVGVLRNNPYVSEVLALNVPWHNRFVKKQGLLDAFKFLALSPALVALAERKFDLGIDILGSGLGSLLLLRLGMPYRLGVKGFAGGHSAVQQFVEYSQFEYVGRAALRFAELLGSKTLPSVRPQIYLSDLEEEAGERRWRENCAGFAPGQARIVVGPGSGYAAKSWPESSYLALLKCLVIESDARVFVVGADQDRRFASQLAELSPSIISLAGKLSLRETFGVVAQSDMVICNSSMLMHVAAAFEKPAVVLLGESIESTKQHAAQWSYDSNCYILGKEEEHPTIATVPEAFALVRRVLASLPKANWGASEQ